MCLARRRRRAADQRPTPSITSAVYNAVGVRIESLPITLQKILARCARAEGDTLCSHSSLISSRPFPKPLAQFGAKGKIVAGGSDLGRRRDEGLDRREGISG